MCFLRSPWPNVAPWIVLEGLKEYLEPYICDQILHKPWANHQAFFQFLADFEGQFYGDFTCYLSLLQPSMPQ